MLKEKLEFDSLPLNSSPFIKFDVNEVELYAQALGIESGKIKRPEPRFTSNIRNSNSLTATLGIPSRKLTVPDEKRKAMAVLKNQKDKTLVEMLRHDSLVTLLNQIDLADEPEEPDDPAPTDSEFESKF